MGLVKSAIGQAFGSGQVQNGFGGPFQKKLPGQNNADDYDDEPYGNNELEYQYSSPITQQIRTCNQQSYPGSMSLDGYGRQQKYYNDSLPPSYNALNTRQPSPRRNGFLHVVLPQVAFGDGQPFLRGYSPELRDRRISRGEFLRTLDAINIAIIPNPESRIFQKGASTAGWFVPGAASIGLMAGQVGAGVASAVGHSSAVNKALSKANLEIFLPRGLKICIASSQNIDNEIGFDSSSMSQDPSFLYASPEQRVASYGNRVAPLSEILPPAQQGGRKDPIALIAKGMSARENQGKVEKAQKHLAEGKLKSKDNIGGKLKCLMVRKASRDAIVHWKARLDQSNKALQ